MQHRLYNDEVICVWFREVALRQSCYTEWVRDIQFLHILKYDDAAYALITSSIRAIANSDIQGVLSIYV